MPMWVAYWPTSMLIRAVQPKYRYGMLGSTSGALLTAPRASNSARTCHPQNFCAPVLEVVNQAASVSHATVPTNPLRSAAASRQTWPCHPAAGLLKR